MEPKIGILSYAIEQGKGTDEGSKERERITRRCVRKQVKNRAESGFYIEAKIRAETSHKKGRR